MKISRQQSCDEAYNAQIKVCRDTSQTARARQACYARAAQLYAECLKGG